MITSYDQRRNHTYRGRGGVACSTYTTTIRYYRPWWDPDNGRLVGAVRRVCYAFRFLPRKNIHFRVGSRGRRAISSTVPYRVDLSSPQVNLHLPRFRQAEAVSQQPERSMGAASLVSRTIQGTWAIESDQPIILPDASRLYFVG